MRTAKTLIRLGGCPGWSESSLGAHSLFVLSCRGSIICNTYISYKCKVMAMASYQILPLFWRLQVKHDWDPFLCISVLKLFEIVKILPVTAHLFKVSENVWKILINGSETYHWYKPTLEKKNTKWPVHPAMTQICLGIRPVWSESSLSRWRNTGSLATLRAHSEDWCPSWSESSLGAHVILLVLSLGNSCIQWYCINDPKFSVRQVWANSVELLKE